MADSNWSVRIGTRVTDDIQKQLDTMPKKTVTVKAVLDNTGLKTIGTTELTKYEDALGNVVVANKKFDASGKELTNTIKSVKSTVDTTSQTLQTASKHTKTLGQDFIDTAGKVAKFGAITAIFGLITSAIGEAISSVKELDASLTELQKVTDLSGDGLQNYTEQAFSMARDLKSTASDVTDAITEFAKSNYTLEESQVLARQAIIFQTIADGAITASDSATMLIQVMKAYNMTVAESEHIVNAINEVSNKYALSSTDLSNSIGKVASSAKTAGVDFESLLGLMTAGTEVTQNASKTANGLKSILVNLMSDKLSDQFKEFGIDMRDSNGAMKDGYTILQELSDAYNNMELVADETGESLITTNDNMNKLLEDLGGKHNINTLTAILGNFDNAINATESAFNSANSASDEYAVAMDSIAKKTEGLQGAFQELVWGDGGLGNFLKLLLDGATLLLNFANDTKALNIILADLAVILAINLIPSMGKMLLSIVTMTTGAIPNAIGAWTAYSAGIVSANTAISASIPIIGLVMVALSGMVMAYNKVKASQEEASESLSENKSIFDETVSTLKTLNDKLEETKDRMNEIESFKAPTLTDKEELNSLKEQNIELERQIKLENERQLQASKKLAESASQVLNTKITSSYQTQVGTYSYGYIGPSTPLNKVTPEEELQRSIDMYKGLEQSIIDVNTAYDNGELTLEQYEAQQLELQAQQDSARARALEMVEITNASEKAYKGIIDSGGELTKAEQAEYDRLVLINGQYYTFIDTIASDYVSATETAVESTEEQVSSLSDYEKSLKDLDATLSILSGTTISGLADAFSLLKDAQAEINDTGSLSIDTYESLMNLSAKYQAILFDENGQLRLNEESVTAVYNAKIDEMAITSARNMVDLAGQLSSEGKSFADLANDTGSATKAGWEQIAVMMTELELSEKDTKALQVRIDGIKQWAENAKKSVGTYSETTKATKTQTKAIDEQREALDKLKDEYKAVTKYIEDQLDSEISRIEDAKSAELDRIDSTIDALNKKRDAEEEYWDNRISALEEQNKATEKQIELEQLQENLALARNKKVMVMGANGWEVREDEQAVAQAEQDVADYTRKQQAQTEIDILNKLKETALANYDSQIQAQEEFKDKQESAFDAQIQVLEGYKTEYNNMINAYEEDQNRLMALQVLGTDFENQTWQARLANLQSYVNRYNSLQSSLSGSVANTSSGSGDAVKTPPRAPTAQKITSTIGGGGTKRMLAYASGVASVPNDGIAITGDNPNNRELVIGSKLNGTATMLSQGSGVVNAQSTKSLAGILNTLGSSMGLNGQTMGMNTTNQSNATSQSIQIANITLPSVTNGQGLLDELRGFASGMLQTAYSNG